MNNFTKLIITSRGRLPYSPLKRLAIFASGNCTFSYYSNQVSAAAETKKFKIAIAAIETITKAFERHKFFAIQSADSGFYDGDEVQLSFIKNKAIHTVVLTNYRHDAFNKIIRAINTHLPKAYRIYFNQLITK